MNFSPHMRPLPNNNASVEQQPRSISVDLVVFALIMLLLWALVLVGQGAIKPLTPQTAPAQISTDLWDLPYDALRSITRMFVALFFSYIFTLVVGKAAASSKKAATVLLPALDILQSVPILGFLSITLTFWMMLFPNSILGLECASIFAIFTSQAWNMTFSFHQALTGQTRDLVEASKLMGLSPWQRFWKLDVPSAMIPLTWNAMMGFGGGWFFLTASEVISVNNHDYALPGIGSYVAAASNRGENGKLLLAILTMIIVIILVDQLFWRPMVAWAQKFRLGSANGEAPDSSFMLNLLRRCHLFDLLNYIFKPLAYFGAWLSSFTKPRPARYARLQTKPEKDTLFKVIVIGLVGAGIATMLRYVSSHIGLSAYGNAALLGLITGLRVLVVVLIASVVWVPIGVWIGVNPRVRKIAQPIVQIAASFPANFLFPLIMAWFVSWGIDLNWGGIFLMALGSQWYILFNVIAGASAIPQDLRDAATDMGLTRYQKWRNLILPAVFPTWVVGALTAAGGAWNASIVAEAVSSQGQTLQATGLGAYITNATTNGNFAEVMVGVSVMSLYVVGANRLIWRRLGKLAQNRFSLTTS